MSSRTPQDGQNEHEETPNEVQEAPGTTRPWKNARDLPRDHQTTDNARHLPWGHQATAKHGGFTVGPPRRDGKRPASARSARARASRENSLNHLQATGKHRKTA